ncbi:MAG: cell surface protein SprA [Candidatus Delongbacteria bacterium]|nr:cell surface protein SprA [Candidatus Delongbacteria bacterium]
MSSLSLAVKAKEYIYHDATYPSAETPFLAASWQSAGFQPRLTATEPVQLIIRTVMSDTLVRLEYLDKDSTFQYVIFLTTEAYYERMLLHHAVQQLRHEMLRTKNQVQQRAGGALKIDIPFKVRNKTFRKFFGDGRIGLDATGNININGGFRKEKRERQDSYTNQANNTNFNMDMQQRFTIVGKIGQKVDINIDQDTDNTFDWQNSLRLTYTGTEDEIIKSISAGNVSLSLPGADFVTFSGRNSGLFGLKTVMQFGPLNMTAIMSVEHGENQSQTFTGGQSEQKSQIFPTQFISDRYFFLSHSYRIAYPVYTDRWEHLVNANSRVDFVEMYISSASGDENLDIYEEGEDTPIYTNQPMRRLSDSEYQRNDDLGYILINSYLRPNDILAVSFKNKLGVEFPSPALYGDNAVYILRDSHQDPATPHWDLMLRNKYQVATAGKSIDDLNFAIRRYTTGSSDPDHQGGVPYIEILHLDNENTSGQQSPDNKIDSRWIDTNTGIISFPSLEPFGQQDAYVIVADSTLQTNFNEADTLETIYNIPTTHNDFQRLSQRFYMETSVLTLSKVYDLGWNVIEGSETVKLNGQKLQRDKDYTIDYVAGIVTILTSEADNPGASLEITYQNHEMISIEKKTIMGVRGQYNFDEASYLGATVLYLNQQIQEDKVRIGNEPMRNLVLDLNGALEFHPRFLTRMIDSIPLVEAEQESEISIEGEIARVIPNPNPLNNPATGDNNGVAYLDDFESIKREQDLGMRSGAWFISSSPAHTLTGDRGIATAYSPRQRVPKQEIWEEYDSGNLQNDDLQILQMDFYPLLYETGEQGQEIPEGGSWGGFYHDFRGANPDQSNTKYIELMVRSSGDRSGLIHIELGEISEDVIPNGQLDTEDRIEPALVNVGNGLLDEGEDIGIDGRAGEDPPWPGTAAMAHWSGDSTAMVAEFGSFYDFWDINGNNRKEALEPWSRDDWQYRDESNGQWFKGLENNGADAATYLPDTEDRNNNGVLDTIENYYSYTLSTDPASPWSRYQVSQNSYGWTLYRIPLKEYEIAWNNPTFQNIRGVRIWFEGFHQSTSLQLASFMLVGNEWREIYPVTASGDTLAYGNVAVINTHENSDYEPPAGVQGHRDAITGAYQKEQSLVMQLDELPADSTFWIYKILNDRVRLTDYNRLKMFIRGGSELREQVFPDSVLEIRLRLASTEQDYYEYHRYLTAGWQLNNMDIIFEEITDLEEFSRSSKDQPDPEKPKQISDGGYVLVKGNPSLNDVSFLYLGVTNHDAVANSEAVYFNELRVSDVKREVGQAQRVAVNLRLSDFMTLYGRLEKRDSEFHTIEQRMGTGDNTTSEVANSTIHLDKFLPRPWRTNIPLSLSSNRSVSSPKYFPGDDRLVPDNPPEEILNRRHTLNGSISFSKTGSENPWLSHTLDKLSVSYDVSQTYVSNDQIAADTTRSEQISTSYSNSPNWRHELPLFNWTEGMPLLGGLRNINFRYFPTRLGVSASTSWTENMRYNRNNTTSENHTYTMSRRFEYSLSPFRSFSLSYNRSYQSDLYFRLRDLYDTTDSTTYHYEDAATDLFAQDRSIQQSANLKFQPSFLNWLRPDFNYSTQYSWNRTLADPRKGVDLGSQNTLTGNGTLKPQDIFAWLLQVPKAGRSGSSRRNNRPPAQDERSQAGGGSRGSEGEAADSASVAEVIETPGVPLGERLDSAFRSARQGTYSVLSKLGDIRLTSTLTRTQSDPGYDIYDKGIGSGSRHASLAYQLGLESNPGSGREQLNSESGYIFNPTSSITRGYGVTTQMKVTRDIDLDFQYDIDIQRGWGETESRQESWTGLPLYLLKENVGTDNEIPLVRIPDYQLRWNHLESLPWVSNICQSINLSHHYSGMVRRTFRDFGDYLGLNRLEYERNFNPLVGLNITWIGRFSTTASYNQRMSFGISEPGEMRDAEYSNTRDLSIATTYRLGRGTKLPFKLWFMKTGSLRNDVNFTMTYTRSNTSNRSSFNGVDEWSSENFNRNWTVRLETRYSFTPNVTGGIQYEFGQRLDNRDPSGRVSFQELRLNVNTNIVGR